ncbi:MAG: AMP-binding protein [Defluviicoccus sp.]|nr:AMP-binding protein [Defluviicoccus sp.]MDE0382262.1 AMP-binding protein [Defluviicoccus sp.]
MGEDGPLWRPTDEILRQTNMRAFMARHGLSDIDDLMRQAEARPRWYWESLIDFFDIRFDAPFTDVLDISEGIEWPKWCVGGTTNVAANCLDRHRGTPSWSKPAIVWEGEDGATRRWSYAELSRETDRLAGLLGGRGVGRGDVVAIYMPMVPEAAAALFAIAKIGAIAMPLFSGFGVQPLIDRLADSGARAVVTTDLAWRRGRPIALDATVARALPEAGTVHTVVVLRRGEDARRETGARHVDWRTGQPPAPPELPTEPFDAETPVMLMYTSGTTGKPKGTIHTHCGVLVKNALDMGLCIDLKPSDRLLWMSDMGWIVGPKIVISAALTGATLVLAEGTPDWPDPARMWQVAARHGVTILGVVPTMVRQAMRAGGEAALAGLDLSALRATISVGEPWTSEAWEWFFRHVCKQRLPILNYAGGTECGGAVLIGSFMRPIGPCAFSHEVPGCGADVVDAGGASLPPGEVGELVLRCPSIGMTRGLWNEPERYIEAYWRPIPGLWLQGDLASRGVDGSWYLHGRSDDTINIAGKRTGPAEVEAVLNGTGLVSESAVVGVPDPVTGSALACVCVPASAEGGGEDLTQALTDAVAERLGAAYRPKRVVFAPDLPRTRNQKIMRRLVRATLTGEPMGDLSSLANPESLEAIRQAGASPV